MLKNRTGVGWYTFELVKRLKNRNNKYFAHMFNFLNRNVLDKDIAEMSLEIHTCKLIPYSIYTRIWGILPIKYNVLFGEKVDIYHFFNYIVPTRIDGKVIVTVYDMVYKNFKATMTKKNYNRLEKNLERSVNRADVVITISESSKKEIIQYLKVDEAKIKIVSPGVQIDKFRHNITMDRSKALRSKYNLPEDYILYLGTIEPRKNIGFIIDAFYKYKSEVSNNIKLVIAGKKGWMFQEIFDKIKKYNMEKEVIFTGYVEEEDKACFYKSCKVFVFPSIYEGFGMPVLEAMASGTPVITSNLSSLPEVAGDAAILINPYDSEELCNAINKVISEPGLRESMIKKGYIQCEKFTWENSIKDLTAIYNSFNLS